MLKIVKNIGLYELNCADSYIVKYKTFIFNLLICSNIIDVYNKMKTKCSTKKYTNESIMNE